MKTNKYTYLKVIQQNYGQGWEDVSEYETNSQGKPKEYTGKPERLNNGLFRAVSLLQHDLKEYRLMGYPTKVIRRKQLKTT
jgi:hypothetical protein